jgi:hypothetical protein
MVNLAWASPTDLPEVLNAFEDRHIVSAGIIPSRFRAMERPDGAVIWEVTEYIILLRPREQAPPNLSG